MKINYLLQSAYLFKNSLAAIDCTATKWYADETVLESLYDELENGVSDIIDYSGVYTEIQKQNLSSFLR